MAIPAHARLARRAFRGRTVALAALGLGLATAAGVSPEARADAPRAAAPAPNEAAEPGAFCTPTSCRPAAASPWTAAAFGAAALAIGWRARRRDTPDA